MKKIAITLGIFITVSILALSVLFAYISRQSQRPFLYFPKLILQSLNSSPPQKLNFLLLGLDRRNDWLEKTETTDTIIYSQYNLSQNTLHLFSLPRDLWDYYLNAKINQIYPLSQKLPSSQKFDYISKQFASISGQPINRVLVLSTENLKQLADLMGGINIYLDQGFIDSKYPNEAYINDPRSGAPIYKTVEFKSGWVHLDSSNITEFVRSRKSAETAVLGGTDLGRIERQQQLINALLDQLKSSLLQNPKLVFKLYQYWGTLEHNFTDLDLMTYLCHLNLDLRYFRIIRHSINTGEDSQKNLLYHPKKFINSQWVFIPNTKDYSSLKKYISDSLTLL